MTGPAARGTERGTRAPSRVTGTQGAVGAVLVVLALGLALRLIIAYLLPGSGFGVDLGAFRAGRSTSPAEGLHGFYQRDFFHDYTPGLSVRPVGARARSGSATGGRRRRPDQGAGDPRRPGHRLARLVDGPRARRAAQRRPRSPRSSRSSTRSAGSTAWSGARSTRSASSSCCSACASCGATDPERAAIFAVVAALIKPQLGILIPIVALVTIRRALWPVSDPDEAADAATRTANRRATAGSTGSAPGSAGPTIRSGS